MLEVLQNELTQILVGEIRFQEPLARYTTWQIGGPAQVFVIPENLDDVRRVIAFINEKKKPLFVLGRGSNILIDDAGLPGVTLYMAKSFKHINVSGSTLRAGGGVALSRLAHVAARHGYTGFEFLIGIPGTVGAGVLINAGAENSDMRDVLESVTLLDWQGNLKTLHASELELTYRNSSLFEAPAVIIETVFRLEHLSNPEKIKHLMQDFIDKRRKKFPLSFPNAGSTFKRPGDGTIPAAGWLLEKAGMKGYRIGNAQVSELHANFIINLGHASSEDVKALIEIMRQRVLEVHDVELERENIYFPEECRW